MSIKVVRNRFNVLLLFVLLISICQVDAKTIRAKNYLDAIDKIGKKHDNSSLSKYLSLTRRYMLYGNGNGYYWGFDSRNEDTIFVCQVRCLNSSEFDEYILTTDRMYSISTKLGVFSKFEMYSNRINKTKLESSFRSKFYDDVYKATDIPDIRNINYVRNWDVDVFKRWNTTDMNDFTYVNAIRIIRKSKHRYEYDFFSYYDNYWIENDPFGWDM